MKRNKVVIIALMVLCITVVMSVLVTRKDLCAIRIRCGETSSPLLMLTGILNAPNFFI